MFNQWRPGVKMVRSTLRGGGVQKSFYIKKHFLHDENRSWLVLSFLTTTEECYDPSIKVIFVSFKGGGCPALDRTPFPRDLNHGEDVNVWRFVLNVIRRRNPGITSGLHAYLGLDWRGASCAGWTHFRGFTEHFFLLQGHVVLAGCISVLFIMKYGVSVIHQHLILLGWRKEFPVGQ